MRIRDWSSDVCSSDLSASAFARVGSALLGLPQTLRAAWSVAPQMIDSLRDSVMLAPRTPLNVQVGPARRVAIGRISLADVRRTIGRACWRESVCQYV